MGESKSYPRARITSLSKWEQRTSSFVAQQEASFTEFGDGGDRKLAVFFLRELHIRTFVFAAVNAMHAKRALLKVMCVRISRERSEDQRSHDK
jgi:hypothetical protein